MYINKFISHLITNINISLITNQFFINVLNLQIGH